MTSRSSSPAVDCNLDNIPAPGERYCLDQLLGTGAYSKVYLGIDTKSSNRQVAIKTQKFDQSSRVLFRQEYKILRELSSHGNLPDFYGAFRTDDEIWFVMELCEGGTVIDLVHSFFTKNRRMREVHIAYILKETIKALIHLHENSVIHRNVKAKNILLTKNGEVKLIDFAFSSQLHEMFDKTGTIIGSPLWMAPEVVAAGRSGAAYDNRVDVWALGITAIELGDGQTPFGAMHPTRALFQIVTNPPPSLARPSNWTENFNDFINECLVKNPEHRPYMAEVVEHPFLDQIPENNYHLTLELKSLIENAKGCERVNVDNESSEVTLVGKCLKNGVDSRLEAIRVEDLASLDYIGEENVVDELEARFKNGQFQTFLGDVLLIVNPNEKRNIYGKDYQAKYNLKSRSDNAPHIFSVADSAYQNALHHNTSQRIVLSGESGSGKTTNYLHLVNQLFYLGENTNIGLERLKNAIKLIHALTHASTPINDYSTRGVLTTEVKYGNTGKVSGAVFNIYQLEKWRISCVDMFQGNFHFLYYIYDGLTESEKLNEFYLTDDRNYRYLRIEDDSKSQGPKYDVEKNLSKFKIIVKTLQNFAMTEADINQVFKIVAAILLIGEIRFQKNQEGNAIIENRDVVRKVAVLLEVDHEKLCWAFTNSCIVYKGAAVRRRNTVDEARDSRDVLANNLYARLTDYIVHQINKKLAVGSAIFGEKYSVKIYDYFGFECFKRNHLPQLFVNTFNEQLQCHYLQRVFSWECLDIKEEGIEYKAFKYFDNKTTLELLLNRADSVFSFIDEASKKNSPNYVVEFIGKMEKEKVSVSGKFEFAVAHFTGRVVYDSKEMPDKNRDFLPPDLIETFRISDNEMVKSLFLGKLSKTGNLIIPEANATKLYNFDSKAESKNQYSQIKRVRTGINTFKSLSLELLKELSIGSGAGGTHFVRCIRSDLQGAPKKFKKELVRQQTRALAVVETAKARQRGYAHRVPFAEFLRRYQFLAFDFNEHVEVSKENCRLLLIRLKMEGWSIGKTKVFLKYYNEEYLSRLYENQVKKIIKIQSILRSFLAKLKVKKQMKERKALPIEHSDRDEDGKMSEDEAALIIQKAYRFRKTCPDYSKDFQPLPEETLTFIRKWGRIWKNNTLFHVLVKYRAKRLHDSFNFAQQVHLFNIGVFYDLHNVKDSVPLQAIDTSANIDYLGERKLCVGKVPFRLDEIPFYDTSNMVNSLTNPGVSSERDDGWDSPYRWRELIAPDLAKEVDQLKKTEENLIHLPFNRDPTIPIKELSKKAEDDEINDNHKSSNKKISFKTNFTKFDKNEANVRQKPIFNQRQDVEFNTKPANKDFNYIRAPAGNKSRSIDPVGELKNISSGSSGNEDEPPFNFQGMLRKTNYNRIESVREEPNEEPVQQPRFNLRKTNVEFENNKNLSNGFHYDDYTEKRVKVELKPGVILEGIEVEL